MRVPDVRRGKAFNRSLDALSCPGPRRLPLLAGSAAEGVEHVRRREGLDQVNCACENLTCLRQAVRLVDFQ